MWGELEGERRDSVLFMSLFPMRDVLAFRRNASRREEGPRRQESPWQTHGLIDQEDTRGWVELLLDTLPDE